MCTLWTLFSSATCIGGIGNIFMNETCVQIFGNFIQSVVCGQCIIALFYNSGSVLRFYMCGVLDGSAGSIF